MREVLSTPDAPEPTATYNQGIKANGFVFTAGQIAFTDEGDLFDEGIGPQTRQCMESIEAILEEAGTDLGNLCKVTFFLDDFDEASGADAAYAEFFEDEDVEPPARSMVEVGEGGIARGAKIEIEAVAVVDG